MADDLIYCPSCRHKLQLPAELYGQTVECPQCHNRFTAPVPQSAPPPQVRPASPYPGADYSPAYADDPQALAWRAGSTVRAPAVALLIVAVLAILTNIAALLWGVAARADPQAYEAALQQELAKQPNLAPEERARFEEIFSLDNVLSYINFGCGGSLLLNLVTILGAIQMLRLRTYGLAMLGSILALNPINMPCCLLQMPIGLWAIIALLNTEVRQAFR